MSPAVKWTAFTDRSKHWHWTTGYFENGWCASVADHSQSCAPNQTASYKAYAICRDQIITFPARFEALAEAKAAALDLARKQKNAEK